MMQAAPAYTAVAVRQSLQHPISADVRPTPMKIVWSGAVRQYVQRAFDSSNRVPGIDDSAMQEKLKAIISQAAEDGRLEDIDWTTHPLPQKFILEERENAAAYMANGALHANTEVYQPVNGSFPRTSNLKKRKSSDLEHSETDNGNVFTSRKKTARDPLEDRTADRSKSRDKKHEKGDMSAYSMPDREMSAMEKRRQRFGVVTPDASPSTPIRDVSPDSPAGPLVGTNQTLEKNYFRLTAPPAPSTVRPLSVLERSLDLIRKKWKKEHNYTYACDQLKSLRQDLTVQHIKNEFTVKVYEAHARIALEMGDLGEYNQCQTQLRTLYRLGLNGNVEEFTAYRILYLVYTCNRTDMNNALADLTTADKRKPGVQHALKVRSALASGNYHKFFSLYDDAPFMGPYLLDMFVQRERLAAMSAICKAYKPDVSIQFLTRELAFHGTEADDPNDVDAGRRQCVEFLCELGAENLIEQKDGDIRFLSGKAGQLFETARAAAFGKVDIKGQI